MKIQRFIKKRRRLLIVGGIIVIILVVAAALTLGSGDSTHEHVPTERRTVTETVTISGTVEAGIVADLGFDTPGRVNRVSVSEGASVARGTTLVSLDLGTLPAELAEAQANVTIKAAALEGAGVNLEAIQKQHDTIVENAHRTLLSDGLAAIPERVSTTVTPPTIHGSYTGDEGQYEFAVKKRDENNNDYLLYVFNFDRTEPIVVNDTEPTRLGTHGLIVDFPAPIAEYEDKTWLVSIPNKAAASYSANLNAYTEALRNREVAIENARQELETRSSGSSVLRAELVAAQAQVSRINAEISQRILRAPFAGTVTQVLVDPGEIVAGDAPAVSLISNDAFGIEVDLPEIDSLKVRAGDTAQVTLDALPDAPPLAATVVSVNRAETIVDGVPVYEARLAFNEDNDTIRSGMTVTVTITTDTRENVIAVPVRAVKYREDGTTYVLTAPDGEEKNVTLGLRGSDGYIEVREGLEEGTVVLVERAPAP